MISAPRLTSDGRLIESYVYLLLLENGGEIRVKVGFANDPLKRLYAIAGASAIAPQMMAVVGLPNRKMASALEADLKSLLFPWRSHGEWFCFDPKKDKQAFNEALSQALKAYSKKSLRLQWSKMSARALLARGRRLQAFKRLQLAK